MPATPSASFHCYLPISEALFDGGLFVTSVGEVHVAPGERYPVGAHPSLYHFDWKDGRTLPEFSLMLITAGQGVFESRLTRAAPVGAGHVIMLHPGIWHRYRPDAATGWREQWMHFNGELAHRLVAQGVFNPRQPVWRPADPDRIKAEIDRLQATVKQRPAENSPRISLQALAVLSACLGEDISRADGARVPPPVADGAKETAGDPLVQAALHHIWTQGHKELAVEHVAAAAGVHRRKLERRFRQARGAGIFEEIVNCRFSRAERLVRETDLPLKSIVGLAGFGGMENMRRVFVNRTGRSPAAYRDTLRKHPND